MSRQPSPSSSTKSALVGFLLGSAATAVISALLSKLRQRKRDSVEDASSLSSKSRGRGLPLDLREEQLSRHTLYFGQKGMEKLTSSSVAVVGLGGVGSHAAHMLARAGVSYLRIIDFDQVTLSSLNRHACASLKDVGTPKATCLKEFLQRICPDPNYFEVDAVIEMYTKENGPRLLEGRDWNIVVDAIDDVPTKAALLAQCIRQNVRVISCMGAGGKSDVTRLHISDLRTASRDPLASKLRQCLKRLLPDQKDYMDDMDQLAVVYSSEKTVVKLADFTEEQKANGVHQYGAVDNMRIRVLPVLGTMPAVMGQTCAALALCELGEKPFTPVTGERVGRNVRHRLHQHLKRREKLIRDKVEASANSDQQMETKDSSSSEDTGHVVNGTWVGPVQIDGDDVEYLMEIWRNRCAITGDRLGSVLELARWDLSRPSTCNNMVLMGASALQKFDAQGQSSVPEEVRQKIEARLDSCRVDAYSY